MALFTATQATTNITTNAAATALAAQQTLIQQYQWVFSQIQQQSELNHTSTQVRWTKADYTAIQSLMTTNGYSLSVLPNDAVPLTDTQVYYNITISWPGVTAPALTGITPTSFLAVTGNSLAVQFLPTGGLSPYNFTASGTYPTGMSFSTLNSVPSINLSGTPTVAGTGTLTLVVVDSAGQTYTQAVTWVVGAAAGGPTFGTLNATNLVLTQGGSGAITFQDGSIQSSAYVLPTASISVAGGVRIDGSSITISGGVISATAYTLPTASQFTLGGIKVDGTSIVVNNGVATATYSYTLPAASLTAGSLGGVSIDGTTIQVSSTTGSVGQISLNPLENKQVNYISVVSASNVATLSSTISNNVLVITTQSNQNCFINFPSSPIDGQITSFSLAGGNLTLLAGTGVAVPAVTAYSQPVSNGSAFKYVYRASATTWYRI